MSAFDELARCAFHADDLLMTDPEDFRGNDQEIDELRVALSQLMGASFDVIRKMQMTGLLSEVKTTPKGWT